MTTDSINHTLTTFKVTEKITGQPPKKSIGDILTILLTSPIRLLTIFNKGYTEICNSDWELLFEDNNLKIEKKLIAATGFDDCIRFYSLSSTDSKLNEIIRGKYFGNFIIKTNKGVFLRQFNNPKNWPNSTLIFISLDKYQTEIIVKSNSAWADWKCKIVNDKHVDIVTEHSNDFLKTIEIRET